MKQKSAMSSPTNLILSFHVARSFMHIQISIIPLYFQIDSFPFPSFPFRFFGFTGHIRVCMFVALNFSLSGLIAIVILYVARESSWKSTLKTGADGLGSKCVFRQTDRSPALIGSKQSCKYAAVCGDKGPKTSMGLGIGGWRTYNNRAMQNMLFEFPNYDIDIECCSNLSPNSPITSDLSPK